MAKESQPVPGALGEGQVVENAPPEAVHGAPPEAVRGAEDAAAVARVRAGDQAAFGDLVDRHEGVVGALVRQRVPTVQDAEDVVQEAFLKAFRSLESLRDPRRFGPWLYGIAARAAIDHWRRRGRGGAPISLDALRLGGAPDPPSHHAAATEGVERREDAKRVLAAVGALPDRYRVVLTLRYLRHLSYRQIAAQLQEPDGTIANRLHRGLRLLKARLLTAV